MIELHHISAGYGTHPVIQDVSAAFEAGTLTSIIGVNGCGKSTLLKAMLGLLPLNGGQVTLDGTPLTAMNRTEIAHRAAYLAQGKNTPDMTVEQMVLHGRFPHLSYPRRYTPQDREIAHAAMEQMGIADVAHRPLHTLSGGMRQNAYLAMALAQRTDYVLLDEPTTYLDIARQLALMRTLRTLADTGKGIVAVMHDLPMALTFSDRILLLDNGTVAGHDTPEQIVQQGIIGELFGVAVGYSAEQKAYNYKY